MAGPTRFELATSGVTGRRSSRALQPGKPAVLKCVLKIVFNGYLKRYKGVQNGDNFRAPRMMIKRQISRGNRARAWKDSNPRPDGAELERMEYLELIARVDSYIPDKGQVMVRDYGLYTNAHQRKVRNANRIPVALGLIEEDPPRPRAAGPRVLDSRRGPDYPHFRDGKSCFRVRDRRFRAERKKEIPINKPPSQRSSRLRMSSQYVARRIVDLARHPRRSLVLPWFYRPLFWLEFLFPGLFDGVLAAAFSRQNK